MRLKIGLGDTIIFYFIIINYVLSYVFELGTIWEFVQGIIFHFTIFVYKYGVSKVVLSIFMR